MNIVHFIKELWQQPYFGAILAMLACFCFYSLQDAANQHSKKLKLVSYGVFFLAAVLFTGKVIDRIYHPEVFDFTAFYLYGKVAAEGYNFYLPENFHTVFNSMNDLPALDYESFKEEIVGTGFLYPPPTILLFAPMGFLSFHTAFICWTIFILLFVPGCIYLIYDQFMQPYKLNGLVLVCSLFFLLSPVRSTVVFSQTNFILLFLLLLMKKYADKNFAGILLTLAFFTKPYMIVFGVYFLLRKKWGALAYSVVSGLLITGITFAFFGKDVFISYLLDNPSKRLPAWVFSESINQSLHAVLIRAGIIVPGKPLIYYCILGAGVLLTGMYLFYLLKTKSGNSWIVLLLVGLLLYPGTLSYYGVLLLFVIFHFFDEQQELGFSRYMNIAVIGAFYLLSNISVFACICFLLGVVIFKSLKYAGRGKLYT